jgi:hypothetical protein
MTVETPPDYIPVWVQRRIDTQIIPGYPRVLPETEAPERDEVLTDDIPF